MDWEHKGRHWKQNLNLEETTHMTRRPGVISFETLHHPEDDGRYRRR